MLDLKIPPPIVAISCAALAWLVSWLTPHLNVDGPFHVSVASLIALLGLFLDIWALIAFRSAQTTVNPLAPERSSTIVRSGPYRVTRNPMYLGMALLLLAWATFLGSPLAALSVLLFIGYITRFQIIPEERILRAKFGAPYTAYLSDVRRWF